VLVVDDTGTVQQKYVTPGQIDGGLRVIKDGPCRQRPRHRQRFDARARRHQGERAGAAQSGCAGGYRQAETGDASGAKSGSDVKAD